MAGKSTSVQSAPRVLDLPVGLPASAGTRRETDSMGAVDVLRFVVIPAPAPLKTRLNEPVPVKSTEPPVMDATGKAVRDA